MSDPICPDCQHAKSRHDYIDSNGDFSCTDCECSTSQDIIQAIAIITLQQEVIERHAVHHQTCYRNTVDPIGRCTCGLDVLLERLKENSQ